jgi:two-component system cell cycle sensor histidine kinase/response regulator CckA
MRRHDGMFRVVLFVAEPSLDADGAVKAWLGTITDVHDRTVADRQLREVQRLQAVGKLAGGVAHEVNNMMSAVLGFGELVLEELPTDHPQRSDVEQIVRAGMRASDVTRQLLAFSRQQVLTPVVLDLNELVDELTPTLRRLVGSDRRLDVRKSATPVNIIADKSQVEQVIINLVSNAKDATTTNGVVRIELEGLPYRGDHNRDDYFARLTVRDDGVGIAPDVLDRVFDPFFTTKPVGQGTGLGMSMVHGIIQQSGGRISIESTVGTGTTVTVLLPLVDEPVSPQQEALPPSRARGETVLVVEDEPVVRSLARRALESAGYTVQMAPNGAAAIEFLLAHPGEIDLILTDVVMPNMNGRQLSEHIARTHPELPVLFMTGYPGEDILQRGLIPVGTSYVQKPFTLAALAGAVRTKLDEARGK